MTITISSVSIGNVVDIDQDGYARQFDIQFTVVSTQASSFYFEVSKNSAVGVLGRLWKSKLLNVTPGTSTYSATILASTYPGNDLLAHGLAGFYLGLYDATNQFITSWGYLPPGDPTLLVEPWGQDPTVFNPYFADARIEEVIDRNANGLASQFAVAFDIDAVGSGNVYVEILEESATGLSPRHLANSTVFSVTGTQSDYRSIDLGVDSLGLAGTARLQLRLFDASNNQLLQTWRYDAMRTGGDLAIAVETSSNDIPRWFGSPFADDYPGSGYSDQNSGIGPSAWPAIAMGSIPIGGSVDGRLDDASDTDWFRVEMEVDRQYLLRLFESPSGYVEEPHMVIWGPTGAYIGDVMSYASGYVDFLIYASQSGTHFVQVYDPGAYGQPMYALDAILFTPVVRVSGEGIEIADGSQSWEGPQDLGFVIVGQTAPVKQYVIRNEGSQTLFLSGLSVPGGVQVLDGLQGSLDPGASDKLVLQMDTSVNTARMGQVSFSTNDPLHATFDFAVHGYVDQPPEITVTGNGVSIADNDSTPAIADGTDFGTWAAGSVAEKTFTVRNDGGYTLNIGQVSVPAGFIVRDAFLSSHMSVGGTSAIRIALDTNAMAGVYGGQVTFATDDPNENPFNFSITGTVTAPPGPEVAVSGNSANIVDGDIAPSSTDHTDFGSVAQGASAVSRVFTVNNTGTAALTTSGLAVPVGYTIVEGLSPSIAAGASDTFTVRLDTTTAGTKSGQINFITNDSDENPFNFSVTGTVGALSGAEVAVSGNGVDIVDGDTTPSTTDFTDFGSVSQNGIAVSRDFVVNNTGSAELTTSGLTVPVGFTLVGSLPATIPVGAAYGFTVRLDTTTPGTKSGQISFVTNDSDENPFNFSVSGTVVAPTGPEVQVSISGVNVADGDTTPSKNEGSDFNGVSLGQAGVERVFTVSNLGIAALTTSGFTVPAGYTIVEGLSASIAAGASDTFTVRLDTTTAGTKSGQISFVTNDTDENPFNFSVTGLVAVDDYPVAGSATTGQAVVGFGRPTAGALEYANDHDWFKVQLIGGRAYAFAVDAAGAVKGTLSDSFLRLWDPTAVTNLTLDDDAGPGADSLIATYTPASSGTYLLDVSSFAESSSGTYEVRAWELNADAAVLFGSNDVADGDATPSAGEGTDFGTAPQAGAAVERVFTVRNDGGAALSMSGLSVPTGFTMVEGLSASLDPGVSDTFTVRLDTATNGTKSGQISFVTNDADENPYNFSIMGTVSASLIPEVAVVGNGLSIIDGDSTPSSTDHTDFGSVAQGGTAISRIFTVANSGTAALTTSGLAVPAGYTIVEGLSASIAAGASDTITVRLDTTTAGTKSGEISFVTNDTDENPYNFSITGTVNASVVPEVAVVGNGLSIVDGDTTPWNSDHTDFGSSGQGGTAISRVFTVSNTGTAALTTSGLAVPAGYTIVEGLSASIAAGASDTFTVRLDTTTTGTKSGQISFATNDSDENPYNFSITGTVVVEDYPIESAATTGQVVVGFSRGTKGNLEFAGDHDWFKVSLVGGRGYAIAVDAAGAGKGTLLDPTITLWDPSGATTLVYDDDGAGVGNDSLTSYTPASTGVYLLDVRGYAEFHAGTYEVRVWELNTDAVVFFAGTEVIDGDATASVTEGTDFGSAVQTQAGVDRVYTVRNDGGAALTTSGLSVPAGYTVVEGLSASLAPGASDTFTVRLDTSTAGTKTGQINFVTNDADENPYNFSVTGAVLTEDYPVNGVATNGQVVIGYARPSAGAIEVNGDHDWFRVQLVAGKEYAFAVDAAGAGRGTLQDSLLVLRDPSGATIVASDDDAGPGADSLIASYTAASTGTYLLEVYGFADSNSGSYEVRAWELNVDAAVSFAGTDVTDGDTTPSVVEGTDFGSAVQTQAGVNRVFTVRNDGGATLTTSGLSVPAGYSVVEGLSASLAPGASDTFTVRLDTSTAGTKTGQISFVANDADENPYNFSVTGIVQAAPEMTLLYNGVGISDGDTTPSVSEGTDFGSAVQSQAGVERVFTVRNDGGATLTLRFPATPAGFIVVEGLASSLAPGESDTFTVRMDTYIAGALTGDISIVTNEPDESPFNFKVSGSVTAAPEVTVESTGWILTDGDTTPSTLEGTDFGNAVQAQSGIDRVFTVRNDGAATLTTSGLSVPAGYSVVEGLSASIAPGVSDTFTVRLDTSTAGTKAGQISFTSNDADENPFNFSVVGTVSPPSQFSITRVSTAANGTQANNSNLFPRISDNGRYVVFDSYASNLVAGDTNGIGEPFRKDLVTGEVLKVSSAGDGTEGNGWSAKPAISADGRYMTFWSYATNLVAGDTNDQRDIFRKDLTTGGVLLVSRGASGPQANGMSYNSALSADGRYVAFESDASNLVNGDNNNLMDVFRKDLVTGEVLRVARASDGTQGNSGSSTPTISPDGRYVSFVSDASNLVAGDTNVAQDVFRKDLVTGEILLVSRASDGALGNSWSYEPAMSADGRYVVFSSSATNLVAGDTNISQDVFRKDLTTGELLLVSRASDGTLGSNASYSPAISADGRYVTFVSQAANLVAGDTNGQSDVFRKDLATGEVLLVSRTSGGALGNGMSYFAGMSVDGRYVTFYSDASNLVAGDTNAQPDIFLVDLGVGTAPEVAVSGNSTNIADGDSTPSSTDHTDFGSVAQSAGAVTRVFTVNNTGNAPLTTAGLAVPTGFTIVEDLSASIAAGASDTFTVRLDTASAGVKTGQISFVTNDADESTYNFSVTGTVTAAPEAALLYGTVAVSDGDTTPGTAEGSDFGSVGVGQAGVDRVFTVRNDGAATLTTSALNVPAGFSVVEGLSASIAAGASDTFTVRLDTASAGVKSGQIVFATNDADENPYNVSVIGTVLAAQEVTVLFNAVNLTDGDTTPSTADGTDFGSVIQGPTGIDRVFTVRNDGTGTLTTGTLSVPTGFSVVEGLSASIAAGQSDTFTVRLDTASLGTKSGQISFATNDADENPFNFDIRASVVAPPDITILFNGVSISDNDSTPDSADGTDFGSTPFGGQVQRSFVIRNDGGSNLAISSFSLPNGYISNVTISAPPGGLGISDILVIGAGVEFSIVGGSLADYGRVDLGPGASITGGYVARPSQPPGVYAGDIVFVSDDPDESPFNFRVTSTVTAAPDAAVLYNGANVADGNTTPGFLDGTNFGNAVQTQAGIERVFTVSNVGYATLTTSGLAVPTGFTIVEGLSASIAAGASDTFTVRMDATLAGTKSGQISFVTNDPEENPYNFSVTGTVTASPDATVLFDAVNVADGDTTPSTLEGTDFGSTEVGQAAIERVFTVRNDGAATLNTSALSVPAGFSVVEGLSTSIAPGATDTFTVRLETGSAGTKSGQISFLTDDVDENPFNYTISGIVTAPTAPEIAVSGNGSNIADSDTTPVSGDSTDFGPMAQGGAVERVFTVTNVGNAPLTTSGLVVPVGFIVVEGLSGSIAAGVSDTFTVRLDTGSVGTKSGQISFSSNDGDESPYNFSVTGTVTPAPEVAVRYQQTDVVDGRTVTSAVDGTAFGTVLHGGASVSRVFTVSNVGTAALTTSGLSVPVGYTIVEGLSGSIATGGTDTFTVRLDTAIAGLKSGQISFTTNDGDENPFNFSVTGTVGTDDYPQEGATTAGQVDVGGTIAGVLEVGGDRDWFRVVLGAGVPYTFDARAKGAEVGTLTDSSLRLYAPDGVVALVSDDDDGPGKDARIQYRPDLGGVYLLQVRGSGSNDIGTYQLAASVANAPPVIGGQTQLTLMANQWYLAAGLNVGFSDAEGDALVGGEVKDVSAAAGSAYLWFKSDNNVAQGGTASFASEAEFDGVWIRGGAGIGSNSFELRVSDGYGNSGVHTLTVRTAAQRNRAPVAVVQDQGVGQGVAIPFVVNPNPSSITDPKAQIVLGVSDEDGDTIRSYRFWDAPGGGRIRLNGTPIAEGVGVEVAASQLSQLSYLGSATAGAEMLWVQAYDGEGWSEAWEGWSERTLRATNVLPVIGGQTQLTLTVNQWYLAAGLNVAFSDADGDVLVGGEVKDVSAAVGSAYLWFKSDNNVAQGGTASFASEAEFDGVWIRGGAGIGSNSFELRVSDGYGNSGVHTLTVRTAAQRNRAPVAVVQDQGVGQGVAIPFVVNPNPSSITDPKAQIVLGVSDEDGDTIRSYRFWDAPGGGRIRLNGTPIAEGVGVEVAASQLSQLSYLGSATAGAEMLWVQAYDGEGWSEAWEGWSERTLRATNVLPVIGGQTQLTLTVNQWYLAAGLNVAFSDADGDVLVGGEVKDVSAAVGSAYLWFKSDNNVAQGGTASFASEAEFDGVWIRGGAGIGSNSFELRVSDGYGNSGVHTLTVRTAAQRNRAPVAVVQDQGVGQGVAIPFVVNPNPSSITDPKAQIVLGVSDEDGDTIRSYRFWDAPGGGRIRLNGTPIAEGVGVEVAASQLSQLSYLGSATAGAEMLWVQAYDGEGWSEAWEGWSERTLRATNVAPTVSAVRGLFDIGQWVSSDKFDFVRYADADADPWTLGQIRDLTADVASSYLWFGGANIAANQVVEFSAQDYAAGRLWARGGAIGVSDQYEVRVYDGTDWSAWTGVNIVTRAANQRPVITASDRTVTVGQSVLAGTQFNPSDGDGDGLSRFRLWDAGTGASSGYFQIEGVRQSAGTPIELDFTQLPSARFVGGAQAGTETLWAQAYDGREWSDWKNWNVTTLA